MPGQSVAGDSGAKAAHNHPMPVVEGSMLMAFRPRARRSTCCGRVYSALALTKTAVLVWLHVSTPMLAAAVLPTYTNNIPRTLLVSCILCAVVAAADKVVTIQPILGMCVTFRYVLIGSSMMNCFKL